MKNKRYLNDAAVRLRADEHLPERLLALSEEDFVAIALAMHNCADEIAKECSTNVSLDLEEAELMEMMKLAHGLDITLNEFIEQAVIAAVERAENLDKN